jgi:hypothetical protein
MRQPLETFDDVPPTAPDWVDMARAPWDAPGWKAAAAEYHDNSHQSVATIEPERQQRLRRLVDNDVSRERAWSELNGQRRRGEAAATTVEALAYSLIRSARVEGFLIDRFEIAKDGRIIVHAGKQESFPSAATNSADEQPCP